MKKQLRSEKAAVLALSYEKVQAEIMDMLPAPVEIDDDRNLLELGLSSLQIMALANKWKKIGSTATFAELISSPYLGVWWSLLNNKGEALLTKNKAESKEIEDEKPQNMHEPFPLTDVQYAYWIGRREEQYLGGVGCHGYMEVDGENVDPQRLEEAWGLLLMHHPMLRARFLPDGKQEILDIPPSKKVIVNDLRLYSEEEISLTLEKIRAQLSHRLLDIEKGEVASLQLSLLPDHKTRLHFDIDLLVADVQSFQIILRDLAAAYTDGSKLLAPVNWNFAEYLKKEKEHQVEEKERAKQYWHQRLSTLPMAPTIPLKENPENIKKPVFKRKKHFVEASDWEVLKKRSAENRVTPAMVLLTAYAEVLEGWSGNPQFLINIPLFDRKTTDEGIEHVVADFTNLLLLEVDGNSSQSFLGKIQNIQKQFHEDVANTAYSGVQVQRDMARLYQGERVFAPMVFSCNLGVSLINDKFRKAFGEISYMISQTPQVWLDFQLFDMDGGLLLFWDSIDDLFPDGLIDEMFTAYKQIITWLVAEDNDWWGLPDALPASQQVRRENDIKVTIPKFKICLHTLFFEYAAINPEKTALIEGISNKEISYGELSRYALQIAAMLKEKGVKEWDTVAITLPRGIDQIAAALGVLASGACYVPVSVQQPLPRRESIHKKAGIKYVLTGEGLAESITWPENTVVIRIEDAKQITPLTEVAEISSENSAYVIFTSGSTGEPKGVEVSHAAAWNTIIDINHRYNIKSSDRVLAVSSLDFDLSVYDIFGLLSVGGSLVLITEDTYRNPSYWLELMQEYQITIWNSVPVLLNMLLVEAESHLQMLPTLRVVMLSGDWIGLDLPSRLKNVAENSQLVAMGGATEAAIWSNYYDVTLPLPAHWTSIPYGRPLTNQAYRVVDKKGRDCPDWVPGELWIGGAGVAKGYIGDPELTEEGFVTYKNMRWYRTGDVGRIWSDGNIEFLGRQDFQVKVRGHRIELGDIEAAIKKHPAIDNAVVLAIGDPRGNKHLVGYVVADAEKTSEFFENEELDYEKNQAIWRDLLKIGEEGAESELEEAIHPKDFSVFEEYREDLSIIYICRALNSVGAYCEVGEGHTVEGLMTYCGIQPRYKELIKQWLEILSNEGFVNKDEADVFRSTRVLPTNPEEVLKEDKEYAIWKRYIDDLSEFLYQFDKSSTDLLKGNIDPLELFFADEHQSPDDFVQKLPGAAYKNNIAKRIFELAVEKFRSLRPVRILEIGARGIPLTEGFLTLLPSEKIAYTCTDNSTFFTNHANNRLKEFSFVQYRQLNIDENPLNQGYEEDSYDIIIASNSLHRSRNIKTALKNVQSLMAPGGILLIMEITKNSRLQQVSTAFLENGFTNFEDERRISHAPLLSIEGWKEILKSEAFSEVAVFPRADEARSIYHQHVIIAQSSCNKKIFKSDNLVKFLGEILPEYMIPSLFIPLKELPVTMNGKIDRKALPMQDTIRNEIPDKSFVVPQTAVELSLAEIWAEILKKEKISVTDSYFELGGDSLLATQLNAIIRKKFNIELSLENIFKKPIFAELAESIQSLIENKENNKTAIDTQLPQILPNPEETYMPFPLTDIQQSYWIGRSGVYSLGNVSTHCYFEMEGQDLDIAQVNAAWQRLIHHHGMMRAVILPDGESQKIYETVPPYQIKVYDLQKKRVEDVETSLEKIREEMSHQIFATDQWPLFDVRASLFGEKRVRLHISFDNIVFDGWSMFYLFKEWRRIYNDPEASLPSLDFSFRDYIMALEKVKSTGLYQRDVAYWKRRLADLPAAPELPLAKNPDTLSEQRFSRFETRLSPVEWQKIKQKAVDLGLTPSGILLTAYAEVLGSWSKRPKFTINLTRFNRLPLHPQIKDLVGDFTSLTLLAVDISSGKTFLERSRNLQEQLWQDLDHPYVSGVFVERELGKISNQHQDITMPIVFTSGIGIEKENENNFGENYLGKIVYGISQTPQVWLDHQVSEQEGELILSWDAIKDIFPEGLLEDMFEAYCKLLKALATDETVWKLPAASLISVPRLEKRIEANNTEVPVSSETLISLFEKQAEQYSNQPAVISCSSTLTYEALSIRVNNVSCFLAEKDIKPNTLVAVVMEKGWEQIVAVLGILKAGAAYLPIDPENPEERIHLLLREGNIDVVLTQSVVDERINWSDDIERLRIDQMDVKKIDNPLCKTKAQPEDLAYVIYTSGSTGTPKGVMIDHRGAVNTILDINKRFNVGTKDRVLALSNLNFDLSVYDIFGMLAAGGTIVMPDAKKEKDPSHWIEVMQKEKVTIWNTVPTFMQMMVEYKSKSEGSLSDSLRVVLLSGDWIPLDLPDKIKGCFKGTQVIGLGGATEASIWSNMFLIEEINPMWKSIPYGKPLGNQRYYVLNELMEDAPVWVPGHLYIGGIGVAKGYWKNDEKTQEKFIHHPRTGEGLYHTGDLGRYLPDGNIEFLGREDFQVKINGYRIELGEIEAVIKQFDGIKDVVVTTLMESQRNQHLVAYVVFEEERETKFFEGQYTSHEECRLPSNEIRRVAKQQALQIPDSINVEASLAFIGFAEKLSLKMICKTLYAMGIFAHKDEKYSIDEMMQQFKLKEGYKTLILNWLDALVEEEILQKSEEAYFSSNSLKEISLAFTEKEVLKESQDLQQKALELEKLFQRDASTYISLLKGEVEPLELLLKEDVFLTPEKLSQFNVTQEYFATLFCNVFHTIVNLYPTDKELRVMEIGTRTGNITGILAKSLPIERSQYLYTDESTFFIDRKKEKLSEIASLKYGVFDFNESPLQQNYEPHSFDIIIADNTLHRSRNLETTLSYLKEILVPGGLILFTETTQNSRLMLNTVSFFEDGYSRLEDKRSKKHLPLLSEGEWLELLEEQKFTNISIFPEYGNIANGFGQHLMIAQAPEGVRLFKPEKLSEAIKEKLPEYMVPTTYVVLNDLPLSANGKIDRKALAKLGQKKENLQNKTSVTPYTETQVKIADVWKEVLKYETVGIEDDFFEHGGDSLRAIQLINLLKERHKIELSLQSLFEEPKIILLAQLVEKDMVSIEIEDYEEGEL